MAEIIAKIGLDHARFDRGLDEASRGWEAWAQKVRRTPIQFVPEKSARDSAQVFEDIERARKQHIGDMERGSIEAALYGPGGLPAGKKLAAESARIFEDQIRREDELARHRAQHIGALNRDRIERALGSGAGAIGARSGKSAAESASVFDALLPPLPVVGRRADGIIGLLRRKFGTADLFKDSLKSLGIGIGVGAVVNRVVSLFSHGAERSKAMADHSEAMVDIQRTLAGAMGGPRREMELQVKAVNELNRDIEMQKQLIASLRNAPLEFLSADYQQQVDEAEDKLSSLVEKQAQLSAGAKAAAHAENLRTEALKRQQTHATNLANIELRHGVEGMKFDERRRALVEERTALQKQGALPSALQENLNRQKALEKEREIFFRNEKEKREDLVRTARLDAELTMAELRDASEVEKKQIRLNALRRDYDVIKNRTGIGSNEAEANRNEQRRLQNEIKIGQQNATRTLVTTLSGVGDSIAGRSPERTPTPRQRGRSEAERIADRGRGFMLQAEEAARSGRSPSFVGRLASAAARDLRSAGAKMGAQTSGVAKGDADALGSPLLSTNKILTEIRDNLKPVKTNSGGLK